MPETFGSGVQGSSFAPDFYPAVFTFVAIAGGDTFEFTFGGHHTLYVITCIMISSGGGGAGSGGFVVFRHGTGAITWLEVNVGADADQFDWRGMLPYDTGDGFSVDNVTGQTVNVTVTGYKAPSIAPLS